VVVERSPAGGRKRVKEVILLWVQGDVWQMPGHQHKKLASYG